MCTVCVHAVCVLGKCVEMCSWLDGHFGDLIFSFEKDNRIPERNLHSPSASCQFLIPNQ